MFDVVTTLSGLSAVIENTPMLFNVALQVSRLRTAEAAKDALGGIQGPGAAQADT